MYVDSAHKNQFIPQNFAGPRRKNAAFLIAGLRLAAPILAGVSRSRCFYSLPGGGRATVWRVRVGPGRPPAASYRTLGSRRPC
jgi:hypothetical protein